MTFVMYVAIVSELVMYGVAPIAALLAVWYVFSQSRAVTMTYYAAACVVALCNLSMLMAGSWRLAMITPYQSDRADPYERLFLPATLVVYFALVIKTLILPRTSH